MRITRRKLIDLAQREAEQRAAQGDVISAYLIGSVAAGEPLLGGTADIDLVLIHEGQPPVQRDVAALSDQIHLDILHHPRSLYEQPRELRVHPWIGPSMCEPVFLFDPDHFFEWAQAGARGQYHRTDHTYARACAFLQRAREAKARLDPSAAWLETYLQAALEAANAAACLTGFPAAGRRLTLTLERRLQALGQPGVFTGFLRLLGAEALDGWNLPAWLSAWARAYDAASPLTDEPDLNPCRRAYYLHGFQALAEAGRPKATAWTLLTTWRAAIRALEAAGGAEAHRPAWEETLEQLGLSPSTMQARANQMEHYLDQVEEVIEGWAEQHGA